jgi:hypothetical protein
MPKKETKITLPKLGLIAATRGMLGTGIGLLTSSHLKDTRRKTLGWTLLGIGVLSTIPLAYSVFHERMSSGAEQSA